MKKSVLLCSMLAMVGCTGQAGEDGVDGMNGMDGMDGEDGAPGQPGPAGEDGQDGQDGMNGQDGQDGADGTDLFTRVVVVSPGANATASGANLLAAIAGFVNDPTRATASSPWLIKIEPGVYNVIGSSITMPPFVDIEGSGQSSTLIAGTTTPLRTSGNAEIRDLTISCTAAQCIAIDNNGSPRITRVTARVENAQSISAAIVSRGGSPTLLDVTVIALGTDAQGIEIQGGSPQLRGVDVVVSGSGNIGPGGINIFNGTGFITDSTVYVETTGTDATGVIFAPSTVEVNAPTLDDVFVNVSAPQGIGLFASNGLANTTQGMFVRDSVITATYAVATTNSDVFVATANTQIGGDLSLGLASLLVCTNDYDSVFQPLLNGSYGDGGGGCETNAPF